MNVLLVDFFNVECVRMCFSVPLCMYFRMCRSLRLCECVCEHLCDSFHMRVSLFAYLSFCFFVWASGALCAIVTVLAGLFICVHACLQLWFFPFIHVSVCSFHRQSVYPFGRAPARQSVPWSASLSVFSFVHFSRLYSVYLSVSRAVNLLVWLFVNIFVFLAVSLSGCLDNWTPHLITGSWMFLFMLISFLWLLGYFACTQLSISLFYKREQQLS